MSRNNKKRNIFGSKTDDVPIPNPVPIYVPTEAENMFNDDILNNFYNDMELLNYMNNCFNPDCDHVSHELNEWESKNKILITEIKSVEDLINLSKAYHCKMRKVYNGINMETLFKISGPLKELNEMIGLDKIKKSIVDYIIFFLIRSSSSEMLHSVVTGSPGCGKTTFIEILSKIYCGLNILTKGHIVKTRRTDLIGKYLGHTASLTQDKINEATGGILLIDEAYSLGNAEGKDTFSKECLDTLNQALSEKRNFICIIAGYKDALDKSFFSFNEGLKRRFPFQFNIEPYTDTELYKIFSKKINMSGYLHVDDDTKNGIKKLITDNYKYFVYQGGDMETLYLYTKITQNKRVFLLPVDDKYILKTIDVKISIEKIVVHIKNKIEHEDRVMFSMYT